MNLTQLKRECREAKRVMTKVLREFMPNKAAAKTSYRRPKHKKV